MSLVIRIGHLLSVKLYPRSHVWISMCDFACLICLCRVDNSFHCCWESVFFSRFSIFMMGQIIALDCFPKSSAEETVGLSLS